MTVIISEDCYGRRKRFLFVQNLIEDTLPQRILDIGCGTGVALTRPIAEAFPAIEVVGVDTDATSIAWADAQHDLPNTSFLVTAELGLESFFDLVIASEVLEHVDEPLEFLRSIRARLTSDGVLMLSVPNGYGPFEIVMFAATCLHGPGIKRRLTRLRWPWRAGRETPAKQTLAVSPHVNFFRMSELQSLFAAAGFEVDRFQPTTLFSGPGIDPVLRMFHAIEWNARVCDRLPPWCASDWMFVLRPAEPVPTVGWRHGASARFRRRLNLTRWGVAHESNSIDESGSTG